MHLVSARRQQVLNLYCRIETIRAELPGDGDVVVADRGHTGDHHLLARDKVNWVSSGDGDVIAGVLACRRDREKCADRGCRR